MSPEKALDELLCELFHSASELRRFVEHRYGRRVAIELREGVGVAELAYEVGGILRRRGLIDAALFERLLELAPAQRPLIAATARRFDVELPGGRGDGPLRVLLVSASPESAERLRVDQEFRGVADSIRGARDQVVVHHVLAARLEDLRTALLEHKPHVLHLSCHGEADGTLRLEAGDGEDEPQAVAPERLARLLGALGDGLRLVVVNACHSEVVARSLLAAVPLVVGVRGVLLDSAAVSFARGFYEALAYGRPVEDAFNAALAGLSAGEGGPQLLPTRAEDSAGRRRAALVPASRGR
ncbi:MAG: CHAT domain-containing protein [Nannocystaceae bacterium]